MDRARKNSDRLTNEEVQEMFQSPEMETQFPPILTAKQAAKLADVPIKTIYDWSSRGMLEGCAKRFGRRLRIARDRFVQLLLK